MMMGGNRLGIGKKNSGTSNEYEADGGGEGRTTSNTTSSNAATTTSRTSTAPKHRKRLNPSARGSILGGGGGGAQSSLSSASPSSSPFPMYQYAINEYAQTVAAGTSNDAGGILFFSENDEDEGDDNDEPNNLNGNDGVARRSSSGSGSWTSTEGGYEEIRDGGGGPPYHLYHDADRQRFRHHGEPGFGGVARSVSNDADSLQAHPPSSPPPLHQLGTGSSLDAPLQKAMSSASDVMSHASSSASKHRHHPHRHSGAQLQQFYPSVPTPYPHLLHPIRSQFEAGMPDATYEESYGDAYTGGTIKYVYPSGYQSMRPRSCPWKISILVCLLFTWLSIFIVGHCSGQVEYSSSNNNNAAYALDDAVVQHDDKEVVLQTRWCGSRPLYLLWVTSMLVTGLAAAYCSVIGYIKVRDFAVGNVRSQPPGVVVTGKSDYYVRIDDDNNGAGRGGARPGGGGGGDAASPSSYSDATTSAGSGSYNYRQSIYQSDGTPQFWGAHIYRPTQAAVAVTSR
jgi:hypothetical protein